MSKQNNVPPILKRLRHAVFARSESTISQLERFVTEHSPLRIVLRKNEKGHYQGLVEHSFCMDFDDRRVNLFWSGKAYSFLGEHILNAIDDAKHNAKEGDEIFDPMAKDCPVNIDWGSYFYATTKFGKRNPIFYTKEHQ